MARVTRVERACRRRDGNVRMLARVSSSPATPAAVIAAVDLPSLIECREDARTYNSFALWLAGEPGAAEALGWQEAVSNNPFLKEYRLPAVVGVFGYSADRIAFTASGPMAVLDAVAPDELAKKLGITPEIATAGKFLGEKVVLEAKEEDLGLDAQDLAPAHSAHPPASIHGSRTVRPTTN